MPTETIDTSSGSEVETHRDSDVANVQKVPAGQVEQPSSAESVLPLESWIAAQHHVWTSKTAGNVSIRIVVAKEVDSGASSH